MGNRIVEAQERLEMIEAHRNKEREEWEAIEKLSFYKRVQLPEFVENLKQLEFHQREAFEKMIKKDFPQLKEEWEELFITFFKELLDEKVHDMRAFMRSINYKFPEDVQ